jgi:hypothetical protein
MAWRKKGENWAQTLVTALLIVITFLTAYSWIWSSKFQISSNDRWVSPSIDPVLYFPSKDHVQCFFWVTGISDEANYVTVKVQEAEGWVFSGEFAVHDYVSFADWKVEIADIDLSRSDSPVHLVFVTYNDGRQLLTLIFVIMLMVACVSWGVELKRRTQENQSAHLASLC